MGESKSTSGTRAFVIIGYNLYMKKLLDFLEKFITNPFGISRRRNFIRKEKKGFTRKPF